MKVDLITRLFVLLLLAETVAFVLSFRFGDLIWSAVGTASIVCWAVVLVPQAQAVDPERIRRRNKATLYYLVTFDLYFGFGFLVERFGRRRMVDEVIEGSAFVVMTICLALILLAKRRQRRSGANPTHDAEVL